MTALGAVFRLTLRHQIWRVTLDNSFYGDYRTKHFALEGIAAARVALEASGRAVKIVGDANEIL